MEFVVDLPTSFGNYKSFLEVGFAVNALFGTWQAIPQELSDRRRKARRANVGRYVEKVGRETYDLVDATSGWVVLCGRTLGIVGALAIWVALFALPDNTTVGDAEAVFIAGACLPVPLAIGLTFAVDWCFLLYLRIRNLRAWLGYWLFILRNLLKVGKTDRIRDEWRKRRERESHTARNGDDR